MDISFVIVNYKSRELLYSCIESIRQHISSIKYEIIIVNNDGTPLADDASLKIINNNENGGFAKACNIGAQAAFGRTLFFLNPDTEIKTSNIDDLVEKLDDPNVGIVAPRLITPSGSIQPWSAGYEIGILDTLRNNFGHIKSKALWLSNVPSEVDWVSGAAFTASRKLFLDCKGFDENFFMYFEDIDLCRRVRLLGKKIFLLPHVHVLHFGGQCYSDEKKQKYHYYQSQDYYFEKHFGKIAAFFIKILRKVSLIFSK